MEDFLVYLIGGIKIVLTLLLLLGWLLAWRFKSKGGGNLLWIVYGSCVIIAAISMVLFQDLFGRNDAIREWFMSDQGLIATLNGGRGLSFQAAQSISSFTGIHVAGLFFCILAFYFWKSRLKKNLAK
jgi:hypothetical protein